MANDNQNLRDAVPIQGTGTSPNLTRIASNPPPIGRPNIQSLNPSLLRDLIAASQQPSTPTTPNQGQVTTQPVSTQPILSPAMFGHQNIPTRQQVPPNFSLPIGRQQNLLANLAQNRGMQQPNLMQRLPPNLLQNILARLIQRRGMMGGGQF